MTASLTTDLCVIGAGSAGLSVATAAAALNVPVVLVEKGEMGGQSLNGGGVPSKALIAAGRAAHILRGGQPFGVDPHEPRVNYAQTRAAMRSAISAFAPNVSVARLEAMNIKVVRGAARFTSKTTLEAGDTTIQARRFVVATGSAPIVLPIPGLELIRTFTTDSIFDLETLPIELVMIGADIAGLQLAQAFRRLGCAVTILDPGKALANEDHEFAEILLAQFAKEGIVLRENVEIRRVEARRMGVRVFLAGKTVEEQVDGTHLLTAAGRVPNVEALGLKAAGVAFTKKGITLKRNLRTSNPNIYAVGEVGAPPAAHAATYQATAVLHANLTRRPAWIEPKLVPRVIFTDPVIAVAGLREEEARRRYGRVHVLRLPFAENDRALADGVANGHIKVVLSKRDRVLGATIVGPHADELIGLWQLAIAKALKVDDIAGLVMPYPTLSEISQRAAATALPARWRRPLTSCLMRLMRGFG